MSMIRTYYFINTTAHHLCRSCCWSTSKNTFTIFRTYCRWHFAALDPNSVTRLGEILPIWQIFDCHLPFLRAYLVFDKIMNALCQFFVLCKLLFTEMSKYFANNLNIGLNWLKISRQPYSDLLFGGKFQNHP